MIKENKTILLNNILLFGDILDREDVTEIVINQSDQIFYEDSQGFHEGNEEENKRVTAQLCMKFGNALAADNKGQIFNDQFPIFGCTLPSGERVQIIKPPAVDKDQFSITIRKPSNKTYSLEHYQDQGFFDDIVIGEKVSKFDQQLTDLLSQKNHVEFLKLAVASGEKNIIIVGETGSGKTTFMKSLIECIPINERIVTIEDTRELFLNKHKNRVNLLYPQGATSKDTLNATTLLKASLRMRPDRILVSELRGGETFDYINAVSSGHGGSITSLHAGSIEEAFMRLTLMFLQNETGSRIPYETVSQIIRNTIDIIIIIKIDNGKRKISTLYWKDFKNGDEV